MTLALQSQKQSPQAKQSAKKITAKRLLLLRWICLRQRDCFAGSQRRLLNLNAMHTFAICINILMILLPRVVLEKPVIGMTKSEAISPIKSNRLKKITTKRLLLLRWIYCYKEIASQARKDGCLT
jgi:hypothetical protein